MPEVIQFKKTDSDLAMFLRVNEPPYTIAKVLKIKDEMIAADFKTKQVNYVIKQVPGFRIFLIHAGFLNKPDHHVSDDIIESQIEEMTKWYIENKTSNKRERNLYKIN